MTYSFQDEVIKSLPVGHRFIRMVSGSPTTTIVHTVKEAVKYQLEMAKVDIGSYFNKIPTIPLPENSTYNDLYDVLSKRYGLGLQKNVDYYNSAILSFTGDTTYVELPVSDSCCAFHGNLRCYIVKHNLSNGTQSPIRDLTDVDGSSYLNKLKAKSYFLGKLICLANTPSIGDILSSDVIELLVSDMDKETYPGASDGYRYILSDAKVIDLFNDGISDIILIETYQGLITVRYALK